MGVKDVNMCVYTGRWTSEPVLKSTTNGKSVLSVSLAVNRGDANDSTDYINIVCWNKLAENVARFTHKGSKVFVEGETNMAKYRSKSGEERTRWDCVAHKVQFLDSKEKSADETRNVQYQPIQDTDYSDGYDLEAEDLPF